MADLTIPLPATTVGQVFKISGSVTDDVKSIQFKNAGSTEIYLQFKVNFKEKSIELNSALENDAGWGSTETVPSFPFESPMTFDLVITVESSHFNILLDEKSVCIFRHRGPLNKIDEMKISGDMAIASVEVGGVVQNITLPKQTKSHFKETRQVSIDEATKPTSPTDNDNSTKQSPTVNDNFKRTSEDISAGSRPRRKLSESSITRVDQPPDDMIGPPCCDLL